MRHLMDTTRRNELRWKYIVGLNPVWVIVTTDIITTVVTLLSFLSFYFLMLFFKCKSKIHKIKSLYQNQLNSTDFKLGFLKMSASFNIAITTLALINGDTHSLEFAEHSTFTHNILYVIIYLSLVLVFVSSVITNAFIWVKTNFMLMWIGLTFLLTGLSLSYFLNTIGIFSFCLLIAYLFFTIYLINYRLRWLLLFQVVFTSIVLCLVLETHDYILLKYCECSYVNEIITLLKAIIQAGIFVALISNIWKLTSAKPFVISVAGNSGVGKDTYATALKNILGNNKSLQVDGDDYHRWDRRSGLWKYYTHLNPRSNKLRKLESDLTELLKNLRVHTKKYNHKLGVFEKPIRLTKKPFILNVGLHSLYTNRLRQISDLKIFIDLDERIRRELKIIRDVNERGHELQKVLKSIERRLPDTDKYIHSQEKFADISFRVEAVEELSLSDNLFEDTDLVVQYSEDPQIDQILDLFTCYTNVSIERLSSTNYCYRIGGGAASKDIEDIAEELNLTRCKNSLNWGDSHIGVMQLLSMKFVVDKLNREREFMI
ncbi:hypothetical protein N9O45_03415 [Planktomarina temperata]|nr:hypothetical protein [Planktomarina temperata]